MNDDLSLYGISEELRTLDDVLDSNGGEINEEWEQKQEMLVELLTKKVDGCVGYIQKLEDLCSLARDQQERLDSFIKSKKNRIANFKHYVKRCMSMTGREEFEGVMCKIDTTLGRESLQVEVGAEDNLPMEFLETKVYAKKKELAKAIKEGQTFEGVKLVRAEPNIRFGLKKESTKRKAKNANNEQPEQSDDTAS